MTYQQKRDWLHVTSWRISGELMRMNPLDRLGLIAELQRENEAALKKRESGE